MITNLDYVEVVITSGMTKKGLKGGNRLEILDVRYLLHLEIVSEATYILSKTISALFVG